MQETSLSHTDLYMNGVFVSKDLPPGATALFWLMNHKVTGSDHFSGASDISKTHILLLLLF